MGQIDEVSRADTQMAGALRDAIAQSGLAQEITFQAYTRVVLPLDGYVFWSPTVTVTASGVLHFAQRVEQNETETYGRAQVGFATAQRLEAFDELGDATLLVASIAGMRFAFSEQGGFQDEARLWHYAGESIVPALEAQLLDDPGSIDPNAAVVSNSLPLWLALNGWSTPFSDWLSNASKAQGGLGVTLYPSSLVEPNLPPPYAVVHIGPEDTRSLQAVPYLDRNRSSWQLAADRVRVTLVGLQSDAAIDFENLVLQYIEYTDNFGLMSGPVVKDAKRGQRELQAIAMQKTIEWEISYQQSRVAQVARTLIGQALATYQVNPAI